ASYRPTGAVCGGRGVDELVGDLLSCGVEAGLFGPEEAAGEADAVMGVLSARPSVLQDRFLAVERERGGMAAMRWFY
ncbi:galactose-1-phosphate uridylyltransferase, partial [Faecalicatena contorta]|nr:galactose-1-phosphate uridylyltransferase [Faecalicatena contorta]